MYVARTVLMIRFPGLPDKMSGWPDLTYLLSGLCPYIISSVWIFRAPVHLNWWSWWYVPSEIIYFRCTYAWPSEHLRLIPIDNNWTCHCVVAGWLFTWQNVLQVFVIISTGLYLDACPNSPRATPHVNNRAVNPWLIRSRGGELDPHACISSSGIHPPSCRQHQRNGCKER